MPLGQNMPQDPGFYIVGLVIWGVLLVALITVTLGITGMLAFFAKTLLRRFRDEE